jgi:hypothetical protein
MFLGAVAVPTVDRRLTVTSWLDPVLLSIWIETA